MASDKNLRPGKPSRYMNLHGTHTCVDKGHACSCVFLQNADILMLDVFLDVDITDIHFT